MKKPGVLILAVLLFVLSVNLVSAVLKISEPNEIYNLGDKIYVTVDGIKGSDSGNLNINLECGSTIVNLLKISARAFSPAGGQSYSLPYKILTKEDLEVDSLDGIIGDCKISVSVGSETASTSAFKITNEISINAKVDRLNYNPGEAIILNVEATKPNKYLVDGFIEVSGAYDFSKEIKQGAMSETFSMPENTPAGDYNLTLFVYDTGNNREILNQGKAEVLFKINNVARSIETSLSAVQITPEDKLTVSADIFDQTGQKMDGDVSVLLVSPNKEETQKTIKSGGFASFDFPLNALAGTWMIFSSFGDISNKKEFEMLEFQKVEFEFQDSILIVKNVGNTRYNKSVDIDVGGTTQKISLDIGVGDEKKFNIQAPNGQYDVSVGDGTDNAQTNVALTGNAISIKDLENVGIFRGYSIVWVFLIVVLLGIGVVLFFRYKQKTIKFGSKMKKIKNMPDRLIKGVGKQMPDGYISRISDTLQFTNKSPSAHSLDDNENEKHGMIDLTQSRVGKAESSLVLKGEKHPSAVIAIHIKNYHLLGSDGKKRLAGIISGVRERKGLVDWQGEHIFIIFSPLVTRTFNNELFASKAGFGIFEKISLQNKKFKERIEFNIGINSGELVTSKEEGKLKYTSIGNTIALARRIADCSSGKLLVSDSVRKRLMRDLKAEKAGIIGKTRIWEVSKMVDREANADKLREILRRMEHS